MTLTVTAGSATADTFVSLDDCNTFCEARGLTDWTGSAESPTDVRESAIRRATAYLSTAFSWKGYRTDGRSQALAWPRYDVEDEEGNEVPDDEIPTEIVQACCYLAAAEAANPGVLAPSVDLTQRIKREKVGPLETEYASVPNQPELARPTLLIVTDLVGGLLSVASNPIVGRTVRT